MNILEDYVDHQSSHINAFISLNIIKYLLLEEFLHYPRNASDNRKLQFLI